jgi:N-acetylglucosaminyl-diphospho-decaprenol L-rhamnosyltransferase
MTLAAVVVTYSPGASLEAFLDTLVAASSEPVEVVLADNGSTDGSVEAAAGSRRNVRLLATGSNLGYGRAANAGVQAVSADWIVIANPDITWAPGALDELMAATTRWPKAGCVGPLIRTPTGEVYPSARAIPSLRIGIGHALLGWWWPANPFTTTYRAERGAPTERAAGWLSGSCLVVRREAFEAIGGFDPGYFMYFEDLDLGERLGRAGWQNVYVPTATVTHTGGHATSRNPGDMAAEHHRSAWRYLSGHYPGWRWWPLRLVLRSGLSARALLARKVRGVGAGAKLRNGT